MARDKDNFGRMSIPMKRRVEVTHTTLDGGGSKKLTELNSSARRAEAGSDEERTAVVYLRAEDSRQELER